MKKIVGILAVAAIATSLFAAEVSAKVKIDGNLFGYEGSTKTVSALKIDHVSEGWNPNMSFSFNSDNAGASFFLYDCNWDKSGLLNSDGWRANDSFNEFAKGYKIWIKPADILKFTFGFQDYCLNQEQIDWSDSLIKIEDAGYAAQIGSNGFTLDVFLAPGWANNWMTKVDEADATVGKTYLQAGYSADFGNINGMFWAEDTFKSLKFGAGYNKNISGIYFFVNAHGAYSAEKFQSVTGEIFAKGNVDAFGWNVFVRPTYNVQAEEDALALFVKAKVTYALDGLTAYLYLKNANIMAKDFSMTIKPGLTGSVGSCGWEAALELTAQEKINVAVPVNFSIAF